jgi:hypothetical protein
MPPLLDPLLDPPPLLVDPLLLDPLALLLDPLPLLLDPLPLLLDLLPLDPPPPLVDPPPVDPLLELALVPPPPLLDVPPLLPEPPPDDPLLELDDDPWSWLPPGWEAICPPQAHRARPANVRTVYARCMLPLRSNGRYATYPSPRSRVRASQDVRRAPYARNDPSERRSVSPPGQP